MSGAKNRKKPRRIVFPTAVQPFSRSCYDHYYLAVSRNKQLLYELILFAVVGLVLFGIDLGVLLWLSVLSWDSSIANLVSTSIATVLAFFAHLRITFARRNLKVKVRIFANYVWAVVVLGLLNLVLSTMGILVVGDDPSNLIMVKILAVATVSGLRFFTFRKFVYA